MTTRTTSRGVVGTWGAGGEAATGGRGASSPARLHACVETPRSTHASTTVALEIDPSRSRRIVPRSIAFAREVGAHKTDTGRYHRGVEPLPLNANDDERAARYAEVLRVIESLLAEEDDWIAAMATVSCELHGAFAYYHWTGFYRAVSP
jgi:hypothetical protein